MSMLRVAGVDETGQPRGFRTDEIGRPEVVHKWGTAEIAVTADTQLRDTSAVWTDRIDVSQFATISLRVYNSHDQPINVVFGKDTGDDNTTYLKNYGGSTLGFTIPADSGVRMITAEEFPFLQYLKNVKLRLAANAAPESGKVSISVIGKY